MERKCFFEGMVSCKIEDGWYLNSWGIVEVKLIAKMNLL